MKISKNKLKQIIKEEVAAVKESWRDYEHQAPSDPDSRKLTAAEAEEAARLGYTDPHDDAFRNAMGAKRFLQDKRKGKIGNLDDAAEIMQRMGVKPEKRLEEGESDLTDAEKKLKNKPDSKLNASDRKKKKAIQHK